MNKKHRFSPPMVGESSLLVIFAVLCLTVFALLTLSSVKADQRLGDASRAAVTGYYTADCESEAVLALLRQGICPDGVIDEGNGIYSYYSPISDTQALAIRVQVQGADYTILRWQAVSTTEEVPSDRIPVWSGN